MKKLVSILSLAILLMGFSASTFAQKAAYDSALVA